MMDISESIMNLRQNMKKISFLMEGKDGKHHVMLENGLMRILTGRRNTLLPERKNPHLMNLSGKETIKFTFPSMKRDSFIISASMGLINFISCILRIVLQVSVFPKVSRNGTAGHTEPYTVSV